MRGENDTKTIVYNICFAVGFLLMIIACILLSDFVKIKWPNINALLLFGMGLVLLVPKTYKIEKGLEQEYGSGGRKLYLVELLSGITAIILSLFKA